MQGPLGSESGEEGAAAGCSEDPKTPSAEEGREGAGRSRDPAACGTPSSSCIVLGEDFAGPEEPVALLLVCRGLEDLCVAALLEATPEGRCCVLPGGGEDGEAAVGKVLLAGAAANLAVLARDAPGVQSAFALLVALSGVPLQQDGLQAVAASLEASPRWPAALSMWRAAHGAAEPPASFRASAVRDGPHGYSTPDLARKLGGAAMRRTGWKVSLESYDTEVLAVVSHDVAVVGLPLFPEWRGAATGLSQRPERFFVLPREVRPYLCPEAHGSVGRMRLRPSTCHLLLRLAGVEAGCRLLDPLGGVGTIAIEAAVRWPGLAAISSDLSADAARAARLNVEQAQPHLAAGSCVTVAQEDARKLSLEASSVDVVVTDVPFGNRNRNANVTSLLPALMDELGRVLRPGGRAALLLTRGHARQLSEGAPSAAAAKFRQLECQRVVVGGWPAAVLLLERTDEPALATPAEPDEDAGMTAETAEERCDCVLEAPARAEGGQLSDELQRLWPGHLHSSSVARRTIRRGRVWALDGDCGKPARQPWWNETVPPGQVILFLPDYPRRAPYEESLQVLYESDSAGVVVKPPGLRLFGGIRTLANILAAERCRALAKSEQPDALAAPVPVHFLAAEASGCLLVAKTARAALRLSRAEPRRVLRAVLRGEAAAALDARPEPWKVLRVAPSIRFGAITEVSLEHAGDPAAFRKLCAAAGHPVLGDAEHGGEGAASVRRGCVYLAVERVAFQDAGPEGREVAVSLPDGSVERFERLFAKEKTVWDSVQVGRITSTYVERCIAEWEAEHQTSIVGSSPLKSLRAELEDA